MERTKRALTLFLDLVTHLLARRVRTRQQSTAGEDTAREVLNQPPRPVRGDDDGAPTAPMPRW